MMTPQEFYAQFLPYAQNVSNRTGLDPRLVLAQAALETGYGKSAPGMNFFGIKSHGRKGGQTLQTSEFENGQMVSQPASFRGYESPEQSFMDYADFLQSNPRYRDVLSARGLEAQIAAMGQSGYATDPDYAAKLANIAGQFDPESAPIIAADAMRAIGKGPAPRAGGILAPQATEQTETETMTPQDEPRGLLGSLGIQKMVEGAEGETGQRFYERDTFKDTAAALAQGFAAMGNNPGLQKFAADVAAQRTEGRARNKTVEYLRANGRGDLADMVEKGLIGGREAASVLMQKPKDDRTALMKNYEFFISQGMSPNDAMRAVQSGTTINMGDVGEGNFLYGSKAGLEPGWRLDTRTGQASVIPGGPAAVEAEAAAAEAERRQSALDAQTGQKETVVAGSIDTLIGQIDKGGIFDLPESGIVGNLLGRLGVNQEAVDFRNELATVQANIAFDRLQQMREASKTGGALGAVSERELDLLMNAYGNINQSTSPARLKENLQTIKRIMTKIENDEVARQFYYGQGGSPSVPTQSNGVSVGEPY